MTTIAKMYDEWWSRVKPPGCPDVQRDECRRAFYSGAFALFGAITGRMADPGVPEDVGFAQLSTFRAELVQWVKDVLDDRA